MPYSLPPRGGGHGTAEFLDQEVMHPDRLGFALRTPCAAGILEVADKLFLLGIDRDHRLARGQCVSSRSR